MAIPINMLAIGSKFLLCTYGIMNDSIAGVITKIIANILTSQPYIDFSIILF